MDLPRDNDGRLSAYAWPGGYPICYVDSDGFALCPDCTNEIWTRFHYVWEMPTEYFIHYEGQPVSCEYCGREIESAYGDPH